MSTSAFRQIPSVGELAQHPVLAPVIDQLSRAVVVACIRRELDDLRQTLEESRSADGVPSVNVLAERIARRLITEDRPRLRPVINATGIILHTNLGRAPLAESAAQAVFDVARHYANVEMDLAGGERCTRTDVVRGLLSELTGAESATIVNNNAAATMIALSTLAAGRSVIVSRGQLIEIGGSFRLPDIMANSGAVLREVGTTNKTRIADYERAIDESTAVLMHVHTSNFRIVGFTESAGLEELVALGERRGLKVIDDIGSGALVDFGQFGFTDEPLARRSIELGADLVLFSGDKLLGGPQAGVLVGRRETIAAVERNPLMRAFRVDKLTMAAMEATLRLYRDPERALGEVPVLRLVATPLAALEARAEQLAHRLTELPVSADVTTKKDVCYLGGGSIPAQELPTATVCLVPHNLAEDELARRLRLGEPPVVARIQDGRVVLDLRTVFPSQDLPLAQAVAQALRRP